MNLSEELLQIVDSETGEPTGVLAARGEVISKQLWCRSTNVFVLNTRGEILCQQRSLSKERYPGLWSTHLGGHVTANESFKINALKELEEEVGLKVSHFQLIPWRTSKIDYQRLWVRDFLTVFDGDANTLQIQKSEIEQVKWFAPESIMAELQTEGDFPDNRTWLAGTHNFVADYQCMRAVLTAVLDAGLFGSDYHSLHKWMPPKI